MQKPWNKLTSKMANQNWATKHIIRKSPKNTQLADTQLAS